MIARKKYFELTVQDLMQHTVWVRQMDVLTFGGTSDDEYDDAPNIVVPLPSDKAIVDELFDNCICWARTRFESSNGLQYLGTTKVWAGEGVECEDPTIVTNLGQVEFFFASVRPTAQQIAAAYQRLGAQPDTLFPLNYRLDVTLPDARLGRDVRRFLLVRRLWRCA